MPKSAVANGKHLNDAKSPTAQPAIANGTLHKSTKAPTLQSWLWSYWELARMHKFPAGSILIFWPSAWGYALGTRGDHPDAVTLFANMAALLVGSTLLHCAACTINDICDREFDRQVERTKNRPIAAGVISVFEATIFLLIQTAAFFGMMSYMNRTAFLCGTFGVFPLHTLYPLMKRWTNWPQAWLGLAMNWGLPTAWLAVSPLDVKSEAMWLLTFGTFCWTVFYDTIYACQDRRDDVKAGVKSTALLFGSYVKPILALFGAAFVGSLAWAGVSTNQGWIYWTVSVGGCAAHLAWQLLTLDVNDPKDCWNKFASNGTLGYVVLGGILGGWYF